MSAPALGGFVLADRSHPIIADRSTLAAACIDMGSVVVDERPTWSHWQSLAVRHLRQVACPSAARSFGWLSARR